MVVYNNNNIVSKFYWCFTPSQPLRLYQGNTTTSFNIVSKMVVTTNKQASLNSESKMVVNNKKSQYRVKNGRQASKQASICTFHPTTCTDRSMAFCRHEPPKQSALNGPNGGEELHTVRNTRLIRFENTTSHDLGLTFPGHHSTQKPPPYSRLWR